MTVVNLDAHRPHGHGPATCLNCEKQWTAVAPTGTNILECPRCHKMAGVWLSVREVWLCRALEKIATGQAVGEPASTTLSVARMIAAEALAEVGWGKVETTSA